jgi:serine/threonine-protein kinase
MAAYLKIIHGVGQGQVLTVPNDQPITIGRSSQASYAFDDALLSRKHCQIESRGDLCRVVDLQSRNGTYVNGQRIGTQVVRMGDRIKAGSLLMEVTPVTQAPPPGLLPIPQTAPPVSNASACESCKAPIRDGQGQVFKNRVLCQKCLDRYDVDEGLIDGFQILERLSSNGASSIYKAKQLLMERLVTLKTITSSTDTDEKDLKRFMREAKMGGRLSHPSIVELYDVNEQEGLMYIVMEFVEGESLEQQMRAKKGPLPFERTLRYMVHICEALKCAHEQSIIHRDVKPGVILVRREDDRAKLSDFALAKNLERAISVITGDGEAVGTPYYMSTEQVKNAKTIDARTDIYSYGAAFYHVLSGQLPIPARSYGEFIAKVFTNVPTPLIQIAPAVPPKLAQLIEKCLAKDPAQRWSSMEELSKTLHPIARGMGISTG